jgi:hypothetical protein
MAAVADTDQIRARFEKLGAYLNEQTRRLAAAESVATGFGGTIIVARVTGVSRRSDYSGHKELNGPPAGSVVSRIRRPGGGRKKNGFPRRRAEERFGEFGGSSQPGDPESPLCWTCRRVRKPAAELRLMGCRTSHRMVGEPLHGLGCSLQANRKTLEGSKHADRNERFRHIDQRAVAMAAKRQPVISVGTKKKELVGNFKNKGRELRPAGDPEAGMGS